MLASVTGTFKHSVTAFCMAPVLLTTQGTFAQYLPEMAQMPHIPGKILGVFGKQSTLQYTK